MADFLRNFDGLSFWLGFLAATLFWWLLGRLRPFLAWIGERFQAQLQSARQDRSLVDEIRLGNDALRRSQELHLAAQLFSLDEILIPPRVLAPAMPPLAYEPPLSEDITDWSIPFMSDWPEMASFYGAPSLSLAEALQGSANLVIIGEPGCGKTVALAHLATQVSRKAPEVGELSNLVPLLVHAADLALPPENPGRPLEPLTSAVSRYVSSIRHSRLPKTLQTIFETGHVLLLLDGLDELSPFLLDEITGYLENLFSRYPNLRAVVTASPDNLGALPALGFMPIPLTSWNQEQRQTFISRWSKLWDRFVVNLSSVEEAHTDPMLLVGWLLYNTVHFTPLELTLKVWAAFAGDSLGPRPADAIESYLRRMIHGQPDKNRPGFEQMASQMILAMQPIATRGHADSWLAGSSVLPSEAESASDDEEYEPIQEPAQAAPVRARGALPDLIESGLVIPRAAERVSIAHPSIAGYLASHALLPMRGGSQLTAQPEWAGKSTTLHYLAIRDQQATWIDELLVEEDSDPLLRGLLNVSRWLRNAPEKLPWVTRVMRILAESLLKDNLTLSLRARFMTALVLANNPGVAVLMRQLLASPQVFVRQLAVLGCGMLRDAKAVKQISDMLNDPSPGVSRAVILALVTIGDKTGMETVAYTLLHGDELLRRAAAEALANHPEEGYPTLEEGSTLEDPAVRRAVVFGLARVKQPWSIEILDKMHTEDPQWVVQDAATQVLESINNPHPRIPRQLPPLTQTAWLISFAGERGMGVAPGKPAYDLLAQALREGDEDQRLAALYYLSHRGNEGAIMPLYHAYFSSTGDIREAAFEALRNLAASGVELPPPVQYGLK